jgi:hypothetical protein
LAVYNTYNADLAVAAEIPQQLLELSYENRLRVLGRFIDEGLLHSLTIIEVAGGFIVRANRDSDLWPHLLEFGDRQLAGMLRQAVEARGEGESPRNARDLVPTGYEDLLRALGHELDQRVAENVVICELPSLIAVSGFEPVIGFGDASFRPFSEPYGPDDVDRILGQSLSRRGTYQHVRTYIPPNFRG